ncbi:hypothetical protein B0H14DRAFT_3888225 [Mycena olivaceomarginata]|nr:hypothetical protein B0H14DRAFT_3888225 [Mycena olivaceomarginata]
MARATKSRKARQNNLQKARNSQKATVEEVPDEGDSEHLTSDSDNNSLHNDYFHNHSHSAVDNEDSWDLDLGNELPDMDCDDILEAEQEPDLDEEIVVAPEITEEKELDAFSQFLFNAQAAAQKAERAREGQQSGQGITMAMLQEQNVAKRTAAKLPNTDLDSSSAGDGFSAAQSPADSQSDSDSESGSEDEDEPGTSAAAVQSPKPGTETPDCMDPVNLAHVHLKELLEAIQDGSQILDPTPETATDHSL